MIIIIIIEVHWMQDEILCIQIIIEEGLLCSGTSLVEHSKPCQVYASKSCTLGAVTTSSGREFHGFTT